MSPKSACTCGRHEEVINLTGLRSSFFLLLRHPQGRQRTIEEEAENYLLLPSRPSLISLFLCMLFEANGLHWQGLERKQGEVCNQHVMLSLRRIGTTLCCNSPNNSRHKNPFLGVSAHGLFCFKHTATVSLWILDLIQMIDFFPCCLLCIHHDVKIKGEEDKQQVDKASSQLRNIWEEGKWLRWEDLFKKWTGRTAVWYYLFIKKNNYFKLCETALLCHNLAQFVQHIVQQFD